MGGWGGWGEVGCEMVWDVGEFVGWMWGDGMDVVVGWVRDGMEWVDGWRWDG